MVAGQAAGDIVSTADKESFEEIAPEVAVAWVDAEFGWNHLGIGLFDDDLCIELAAFGDEKSGQEFLGAGDLASFVGEFFEERVAGERVDDDGGLGLDFCAVGGGAGVSESGS